MYEIFQISVQDFDTKGEFKYLILDRKKKEASLLDLRLFSSYQ